MHVHRERAVLTPQAAKNGVARQHSAPRHDATRFSRIPSFLPPESSAGGGPLDVVLEGDQISVRHRVSGLRGPGFGPRAVVSAMRGLYYRTQLPSLDLIRLSRSLPLPSRLPCSLPARRRVRLKNAWAGPQTLEFSTD